MPAKSPVGLAAFRLGIQQRSQLMETLGAGQLVSIRRTFDESGSPAGSWAPLSPSTLRWGRGKYGSGHKLLVQSGLMENSIHSEVSGDSVVLGTSMLRARVHQFGFSWTAERRRLQLQPARVFARSLRKAGDHKQGRAQADGAPQGAQRCHQGECEAVHSDDSHPGAAVSGISAEDPERMAAEVQGFLAEQARIAGLGAE